MKNFKLFAGLMIACAIPAISSAQMNVVGQVQPNQIPNLAASATTDTTNAANISSGTLPFGRIPTGTSSTTVAIGNDSRFNNATKLNSTSIATWNGFMFFTGGTPAVGTASNITGLFTGTCSGTTFLRGDGSCQTPAGTSYTNGTGISLTGNTFSTAPGVPVWQKVSIPYSSVSTAATTNSVNILTLAARQKVCGLSEKHTTAFAGTSITALTVTVGDSAGTTTTFTNVPFDVMQAVSNTAFQDVTVFGSASYAGGNVTANFTATGANLSALTAGSIDFDVCTVTMP